MGVEKYKDTDTVTYTGGFNLWFAECICRFCSFNFHCNVHVDLDMLGLDILSFFFPFWLFLFSIEVTLTLF